MPALCKTLFIVLFVDALEHLLHVLHIIEAIVQNEIKLGHLTGLVAHTASQFMANGFFVQLHQAKKCLLIFAVQKTQQYFGITQIGRHLYMTDGNEGSLKQRGTLFLKDGCQLLLNDFGIFFLTYTGQNGQISAKSVYLPKTK